MNESTPSSGNEPTYDQIAQLAYSKYLERGAEGHGFDLQDWFDAEAELRGPISTASQEAAVRGAEAEAAQEKREAELDGPLPPEALALTTDEGTSLPGAKAKPRTPRKSSAKAKTTTADVERGNATPEASALQTDAGESIPGKGRSSRRATAASKADAPGSNGHGREGAVNTPESASP